MLKGPRKHIWNASFILFALLFLSSFAYYSQAENSGSGKNFLQDTDGDGLSNDEEIALGTDPLKTDSDGDGYSDGVEVKSGFNPLKPAPGDKLTPESTPTTPSSDAAETNITEKTSNELASIVKDATTSTDPESAVSTDDIDTALENAMGSANAEIVLPTVDIKDIKIKKLPKGLKGDAKDEQVKKDVLEYLTLMSYIIVSNSPVAIDNENDIQGAASEITTDSLSSLTSGNFAYLDTLEQQGKKFLDEIKDIEVPESMVETHMKALQLAQYAVMLKSEVETTQTDPLGQVAAYGKVQAFFSETQTFSSDVLSKLSTYGISELPLSL